MSHTPFTKILMDLKDTAITLAEELAEKKKYRGPLTNVIYGKLTDKLGHCPLCRQGPHPFGVHAAEVDSDCFIANRVKHS